MTRLEVNRLLPQTRIVLRTPPNWGAVLFFVVLSLLHAYFAASAMFHQRWEGYMSVIFACVFALVSLASWRIGTELSFLPVENRLRLRTGFHRLYTERFIPFTEIRDVRLTLLHPRRPREATIELVCDLEVIECPPSSVPREEALCLAMTIGVGLTKVYSDAFNPAAERLDQLEP